MVGQRSVFASPRARRRSLGAAAVLLAVVLAAAASFGMWGGAGSGQPAQPAWVSQTSASLARQWFPGQLKPSVSFHYGSPHSLLTLTFAQKVTCNCPAPRGALVSGKRAVFTLDTRTQRMLSFQVFAR